MNSERILYPLTDPQYQIWLSHESCPDRALFTESALVSFPAETAPSFLCEKLNRLVEETEVLRIRLCLGEDGPAQYDGGYRPFFCHPFPLESEEELAAQFDAASREPFPCTAAPCSAAAFTAPRNGRRCCCRPTTSSPTGTALRLSATGL